MRVLVVNNLRAGQGDAGLFDYVRELSALGAEVTLRGLHHVGAEAALRDAEDFDRVVAAGGDGTVSSVAYALRNTKIPLLPYPAGTANLLAMNLRIPIDPARCAEVTLAGERIEVDMGELSYERPGPRRESERRARPRFRPLERTGFVNSAGAGFDASIMEGAAGLKSQIGAGAYLVSAMQNIEPEMADITMRIDGVSHEVTGSAVLIVNFARIQFDLTITHDSQATDGILEVVVIKVKHVAELFPAVVAAFIDTIADYPDRGGVLETFKAREIEVDMVPQLPLQADGETLRATTPFTARVLPLAADFVVPSAVLAGEDAIRSGKRD